MHEEIRKFVKKANKTLVDLKYEDTEREDTLLIKALTHIETLLKFIDDNEIVLKSANNDVERLNRYAAKLEGKIIKIYCELNGLEKCEFIGDCDKCKSPKGATWAAMIYSDVTEAEYYICEKCIIQQVLSEQKETRCPVCNKLVNPKCSLHTCDRSKNESY